MAGESTRVDPRWVHDQVARYEGPLLRYAWRITGDLESARDVVQETFLRLWERPPATDDAVGGWLYTVCRNRCLDLKRKGKHMQPNGQRMADGQPSGQPGPDAAAQADEAHRLLAEAMRQLSPAQQEVLQLKFQGGFSYRQIAEVTGLSVSNVGFHIHAGLDQLRRKLHSIGLLGQA